MSQLETRSGDFLNFIGLFLRANNVHSGRIFKLRKRLKTSGEVKGFGPECKRLEW